MPTYELICTKARQMNLQRHPDRVLYIPTGTDSFSIRIHCFVCGETPTLVKRDLPSHTIMCYFGLYKKEKK